MLLASCDCTQATKPANQPPPQKIFSAWSSSVLLLDAATSTIRNKKCFSSCRCGVTRLATFDMQHKVQSTPFRKPDRQKLAIENVRLTNRLVAALQIKPFG